MIGSEGIIEISNNNKPVIISTKIKIQPEKNFQWILSTSDGREFVLSDGELINLAYPNSKLKISKKNILPDNYFLMQNFPNPFNPITNIEFVMPDRGRVRLTIYDMLGKSVRSLLNMDLNSGLHNVIWDGTDNQGDLLSSGCYFYQMKVVYPQHNLDNRDATFIKTRKMLYLK